MSIHVVPNNDFREHDQTIDCWCEPRVERVAGKVGIVVHNSADGRETEERETGKITEDGKDWTVVDIER